MTRLGPRMIALCLCLPGLARADLGDNAVGMNAHIVPTDVLDALENLGVPWVRVDNNWFSHEPRQGEYDWAALDRMVDESRARGLEVFMSIAYTPPWASDADNDDVRTNNLPRPGLYEAYVEATVRRYSDRVTHFGMWNEPNLEHFLEGSDAGAYVERILRPGAAAVRRACPTCKVLGPDTASVGNKWEGFLEATVRAGDAVDILTHHVYRAVPQVRAQWACDDFDHAIDIGADAICFYRPGLVQLFERWGFAGEVWLTELGHRGDPWDAAGEQQAQVDTMQHILDLQLQRPWWTNSFFYEILDCRPIQPDCDIDGYGFIRRQAGPDESWDDNFVLKPVYEALRRRIEREPVWTDEGGAEPPPPPPPPPPPEDEIQAPHRAAGAPDGVLDDWDPSGCVVLRRYERLQGERPGAGDLSARACAAWSDEALWLSVEVSDDVHDNGNDDDTLWLGDSIQLAIDVAGDAAAGEGYGADDLEIALASVGGESRLAMHWGERGGTEGVVRREGDRTAYELRVPLANLAAGRVLRASFLVNEADGEGRDGWLEWTPGIGLEKAPAAFGRVVLSADEATPPPDPPPPEADGGRIPPPLPPIPDAASDADPGGDAAIGPAPDGGGDPPDAGAPPRDAGDPLRLPDAHRLRPDGGAAADGGEGGCGCRQGVSGAPALLLLLPLLLGRRRRR